MVFCVYVCMLVFTYTSEWRRYSKVKEDVNNKVIFLNKKIRIKHIVQYENFTPEAIINMEVDTVVFSAIIVN